MFPGEISLYVEFSPTLVFLPGTTDDSRDPADPARQPLHPLSAFPHPVYGAGRAARGLNGGWTFLSHQYFEIALLFYIYWYLNAVVRPSRWQAFLAAAPILLAYIGQDIYYLLLGKVFRFVELTEVKELLNVTSTTFLALIVLAAVIPFCGMLWCINYRRPKAIVLGLLPLVLVVAATQYSPEKVVRSYRLMRLWVVNWSDEMPVELNGRFVMLVYREAERRISLNRTATFQDRPAYELEARKRAEWLKKRDRSGMSIWW